MLLFFAAIGPLHAMDIYIAPFLYVDEAEDRVSQQSGAHNDVLRQLNRIETGAALQFFPVDNTRMNPPQSVLDAVRVCRDERLYFLLYGYVTKKDYTYYAEIRLYDYEKRAIIQSFYGADDHGNYERMIEDMAHKIVRYVDGEFHLAIAFDEPEYYEFWLPFNAGYWTAMGRQWTDLLLGVAAVSAGVEFIPNDRQAVLLGKSFYASVGISAGYRFGMGNEPVAYEAADHIITVKGSGRLHMRLSPQHSLFVGFGVSYSADILRASEHYLEPRNRVYHTPGIEGSLGYYFKITPEWALSIENIFERRFFSPPMIVYSPRVGAAWRFYRREVIKKW
jgi:hypothetical protein